MTEHRQVPEPGELVYQPSPSWAPVIFSFALALALCGVFISFMLPGWIYSLIGLVAAAFALRSMAQNTTRSYYQLPRKQRIRGAALPVETISSPKG